MKNISDYIDLYCPYTKTQYYQECYLNSMRDFFEDELPEGFNESLNELNFIDYILESLTTHDINKLKCKLEEEFDNIECRFINDKQQSLQILSSTDISKDKRLEIIINVFGYYITRSQKIDNQFIIDVCPTYAKNADTVVTKNHNKLYHFATGEFANEIETKGLRCKSSRYRKYPERIYLYASDKHLDKIPDIEAFIKKVTNPFDRRQYGVIVYRIDLNKLKTKTHINFYTDDYMDEDNAVYTYNNIPPECIKRINY